MKRSILLCIAIFTVVFATDIVFQKHIPTAAVVEPAVIPVNHQQTLPKMNVAILKVIEESGATIAFSYSKVVCTEFVIGVLDRLIPVTAKIKKDIRIITTQDLETLVKEDAQVIKGVQTALVNAGIGTVVEPHNAMAGDLVQFWNLSVLGPYGHCGFVVESKPGEYLTMYSSHPITGGFGKQTFPWPEKIYCVRLEAQKKPPQHEAASNL
ncbi:hypothetical protein [Pseudochryseolinea flava]|uniref:Uncharacterized protein n=1 Tax=Pseudochryseolinea flava TaxID=2059302 RepID=A0A364Y143_9BACT|nr:hypothetical protein [Pseudochryseolinea flava]RAW00003.1 hypothetical protein DQQ10_15710 [Pseudochryseolinea flava]